MERKNQVCRLLVIGRSGVGVTSSMDSLMSRNSHKKLVRDVVVREDLYLSAIDCSGFADAGDDCRLPEDTLRATLDDVMKRVNGFHILVYVLQYGVRFTLQEQEAIQKVKSFFGNDVFRKKGIILMSYGDNFELENEGVSFLEWCCRQTGNVKAVFEECQYRVVLFNNKVKGYEKRMEQRRCLIENVNSLISMNRGSGNIDEIPIEVSEQFGSASLNGSGDFRPQSRAGQASYDVILNLTESLKEVKAQQRRHFRWLCAGLWVVILGVVALIILIVLIKIHF
ncbi:uncharacterized protein LOC131938155 [Physella acuta]|uniref:uncharacterized protein LOC131938155 n=1 Tax=Physella acuta TaxID=109671 RepID=UPI0027DC8723|nr:uncharacterized protein LOC131938155 [Physella acuta]